MNLLVFFFHKPWWRKDEMKSWFGIILLILRFSGKDIKSSRLLGYYSVSLGKQFSTLRMIVVASSSRSRSRVLDPENEGTKIFRNMGNCLPNDAESNIAGDFIVKQHRSQNLRSRKTGKVICIRHFSSYLVSGQPFQVYKWT